MVGTIDITIPASISGLSGTTLLSLDTLPPDGIVIADSNSGLAITVTLVASSAAASLSASSAGGASIGNTSGGLTISGTQAQVNAALASLNLASSATLGGTLSITASDALGAARAATIALTAYADPPLAFVAPPPNFASSLGVPAPLAGLTLAADGAAALGLAGAAPEAMSVTLISSNGPLLLDPGAAPGIVISGEATGTLVLGFASSQLAEVNAVLAAVELAESGAGTLRYIARDLSGALAPSVTSGSLAYSPNATPTASSESWLGGNGRWQAGADWSGGVAPNGDVAVSIGGGATIAGIGAASVMTLQAGASLVLAADIALEGSLAAAGAALDLAGSPGAPAALSAMAAGFSASTVIVDDGALAVSGLLNGGTASSFVIGGAGTLNAGTLLLGSADSLLDFGSLGGGALDLGPGAEAFLPGGGVLGQAISLGAGAVVDFAGLLDGGATAAVANPLGLTLATGAILEGGGTLVAGDFSEAGAIDGPGTILALGPAPLTIGGGALIAVDPGAVVELGAVSPLYGVFNPTPVTVDSSVTISFAPGSNATQDAGLYPSARGEQGGVLLLDYPGQFAGTIAGFAPGDRIGLPELAGLSLSNFTGRSFVVSGTDAGGAYESATINAAYASGLSPFVETDTNGDDFIGLRAATAQLTLNDVPAVQAVIDAVSGYQEPVAGLGILLPTGSSAALALTIAAVNGLVAEASGTAMSTITLTGSTGLALDELLGGLRYTPQGGGSGDTLRFTGSGGGLSGFSAAVAVSIATAGTLDYQGGEAGAFGAGASWSGGNAPANGDVVAFGSHAGAADIVSGSGEAGAMTVSGAYDFAGTLGVSGQSGAALAVDAGGTALFDANAVISLGGGFMIGDASGTGTAGIAGSLSAQGVTIAGSAGASGSRLDISGSLTGSGTLAVGNSAAGRLDLTGGLAMAQTTIGSQGLLRESGAASFSAGTLDLAGGVLALSDQAAASASALIETGGTLTLAGQARLTAQSADITGGTLAVGAEAKLSTSAPLTIAAGAVLSDFGAISVAALTLSGAATLANGSRLAAGGGGTLMSGASLSLQGGTLTASGLSIAAGATLSGTGEIGGAAPGTLPAIGIAGGVTASGGTLTLGGDVTGNVTIGSSAALDLVHGATGGTISFTGAGETLIINDVAVMQDTVSGMVAGDAIELAGVAPGEISIANGLVTIADPSSFGFSPAAAQPAPQASANSTGSTITMGGEMPCFARGTKLLTPSGYRPVEALAPGDPLVTDAGQARGIVWIGKRVIDLATDPAAFLLRPVVIAAGAFGRGLPLRTLRLSPLHAIHADGALIPAVLLVNGATITQDNRVQAVTYYHVELARHDVVRAEGLAVETYRDTGNRHRFAEGRGVPGAPMPACAPLITGGAGLARVRRRLHEQIFARGYRLNHAPDIRFRAGETMVAPVRRGRRLTLVLPDHQGLLCIGSRIMAPAEIDPLNEDRRRLGVCIGGIRVDGRPYEWDAAESAGWHPRAAKDRGVWTMDEARLPLPPGATRLGLDIVATLPAWLAPAY